jgi:hypothetical protein
MLQPLFTAAVRSEDVRRALELTEKMIAELDKLKAENERLLREVVPRLERDRAELRRAGYLR